MVAVKAIDRIPKTQKSSAPVIIIIPDAIEHPIKADNTPLKIELLILISKSPSLLF